MRSVEVADAAHVAVAAHPDGHGVLRGVSAEPEVVRLVGGSRGAGLACHGLVDVGAAPDAGAVGEDALEHVGDGRGGPGAQDLLGIVLVLVDGLAVAGKYLADRDGVAVIAAVGEGGVRGGHLHGVHLACAEGHGQDVGEVRGVDAELVAHRDDVLVADRLGNLEVAGVGGLLRRAGKRDVAHALVAVVLAVVVLLAGDLPGEGGVAVDDDVGVHPHADGGGEGERLEGRAGLAAVDGVVEVGRDLLSVGVLVDAVVIAPADHGLDEAGLGIDDGHADVEVEVLARGGRVAVDVRDRGTLGDGLDVGVDGGLDGQAALEKHVRGELLLQERLDVVDEVRLGVHGDARVGDLGDVEREGLRQCRVVLLLRDGLAAQHVAQDLVSALDGDLGVDGGVVVGGRVGQADEQGGLGEGEVARVLGEVRLGGGLDAVGAVTVVDAVEVHHQDLVLGVDLLHLQGDERLADLALDGLVELLLGEDGVAHELLGDGRGALGAARELRQHGATDADDVDAGMLVEALVLDVHGALEDPRGDLVRRDARAVLDEERGDLVIGGIQDVGGLAHEVLVCVGVIRQVGEPTVDVAEHAYAERDAGDEHEAQDGDEDDGGCVRFGAVARATLTRTHGRPPAI